MKLCCRLTIGTSPWNRGEIVTQSYTCTHIHIHVHLHICTHTHTHVHTCLRCSSVGAWWQTTDHWCQQWRVHPVERSHLQLRVHTTGTVVHCVFLLIYLCERRKFRRLSDCCARRPYIFCAVDRDIFISTLQLWKSKAVRWSVKLPTLLVFRSDDNKQFSQGIFYKWNFLILISTRMVCTN